MDPLRCKKEIRRGLVVIFCFSLCYFQLGCARGSFARRHPYKTTFIALGIVATAGILAYLISEDKKGGYACAPAQSNYIKGYYRDDGTYVRSHYRTPPDETIANNYGLPSPMQIRQYGGYRVLPTYLYDFDDDGIVNQYDSDDDNDTILDIHDKFPYNPDYY